MNNFLLEVIIYGAVGFFFGLLIGDLKRKGKEERNKTKLEVSYLRETIAELKRNIRELKGEKINPFLDENGNPLKQGKIEKG